MIVMRRASDRGHADHGWLDSRHTFSFGQYHDPAHRGFSALRVINQDVVAPGHGFPMHPHHDFEIYSWIVSGSLAHADTTGARATIEAGGLQLISAGTGVAHEEYNPSETDPVHFLQVWLHPDRAGYAPRYLEAQFDRASREGRLRPILVPEATLGAPGTEGALPIRQDASVYVALLDPARSWLPSPVATGEGLGVGATGLERSRPSPARPGAVTHFLPPGRAAWIHVATGTITLDGQAMGPGDGAAVTGQASVTLAGAGDVESEVMLFDLAAPG